VRKHFRQNDLPGWQRGEQEKLERAVGMVPVIDGLDCQQGREDRRRPDYARRRRNDQGWYAAQRQSENRHHENEEENGGQAF
jgi:hypothetical protein